MYYYINGNSNYKEKSGSVIVTIKKYDLSTNGIIGTINDQTYTGSAVCEPDEDGDFDAYDLT